MNMAMAATMGVLTCLTTAWWGSVRLPSRLCRSAFAERFDSSQTALDARVCCRFPCSVC